MGLLLWRGLARAPGPATAVGNAPANAAPVSDEGPAIARAKAEQFACAEETLRGLLASAQDGDVPAYLSAFAPEMRPRLEAEVARRGQAAFAADLKRASAARKSHAMFAPEPDGPDAVRITVESVYPDRNERQTYMLTRASGKRWQVTEVESVHSHTPKAKFGTLAEYQEPEGVPVQGVVQEQSPRAPAAGSGPAESASPTSPDDASDPYRELPPPLPLNPPRR